MEYPQFDFNFDDDYKVCNRLRAILYSLKSCGSHLDRVLNFLDSLLSDKSPSGV